MPKLEKELVEAKETKLEPQKKAILHLIQKIHEYEKGSGDTSSIQQLVPSGTALKPYVLWNTQEHPTTSENILDTISRGDLSLLTQLHTDNTAYSTFSFLFRPDITQEEEIELIRNLKNDFEVQYPSFGSSDIRLLRAGHDGSLLYIFANQGYFTGMEQIWQSIIDEINYPILVEDRGEFKCQNTPSIEWHEKNMV